MACRNLLVSNNCSKRMYINKTFLIVVLTILIFGSLKAQEHLEPVGGVFDIYDHQFEYYPKVREILLKNSYDSPDARFLMLPSFDGETVVDLLNENDKYTLEYRKAERNIWYSLSDKKIEVKIKSVKKDISKEDAELIINLFEKLIMQVRYPETKIYGTDGVNYYFSSGNKSGKVWSPNANTKMSRLVDIGNDLMNFCLNKDLYFEKDFKDRIKKLTEEE